MASRSPLWRPCWLLLVAVPTAAGDLPPDHGPRGLPGGAGNDGYVVAADAHGRPAVPSAATRSPPTAPGGGTLDTFSFTEQVDNGQNQLTCWSPTRGYAASFGVGPRPAYDSGLSLAPAGGAVCWDGTDRLRRLGQLQRQRCRAPPARRHAAAIPAGTALRRTIAPGCPTLLEAADDHDNSAADFSPWPPARAELGRPRRAELRRPAAAERRRRRSRRSGSTGRGAPQTTLRRKPAKRPATARPPSASAPTRPTRTSSARSTKALPPLPLALHHQTALARPPHLQGPRPRRLRRADPSPAVYAFTVLPRR